MTPPIMRGKMENSKNNADMKQCSLLKTMLIRCSLVNIANKDSSKPHGGALGKWLLLSKAKCVPQTGGARREI